MKVAPQLLIIAKQAQQFFDDSRCDSLGRIGDQFEFDGFLLQHGIHEPLWDHEQGACFAAVQPLLQGKNADLRLRVHTAHFSLHRRDSTELLVVDQLVNRRTGTAHRAVRDLPDRDLPEPEFERVDQQEPPDERFTPADQELDRFGRLDRSDDRGSVGVPPGAGR